MSALNLCIDQSGKVVPELASLSVCSGFGQWHSPNNERDPIQYTSSTLASVRAMLDNPPSTAKENAQWVILSALPSRVHAEQREQGHFVALWADIDDNSAMSAEQVYNRLHALLPGFIAYTSRSATKENQKLRIIVPLTEAVSGSSFVLLQKILNNKLEKVGITPDRVTERAGQVCYLPNKGEFWSWDEKQGALDPTLWNDDLAQLVTVEKAAQEALQQAREQARLKAAQRMATGCKSPIDAFNREYPLDLMLQTFGYTKRGKKYISPNSESGVPGVSITADGLKWISAHGSDRAIGKQTDTGSMGDAFDLFTYYQHGGNRKEAIKTTGKMFSIDGVSITDHNQREFMANKSKEQAFAAFEDISEGETEQPELQDQPTDSKPGFIFHSVGTLMQNMRAPDWLIKGIIERDSLAEVHGAPGHGKSFVVIDMAASIATGTDWHGHRTTQGAVFYIAGEGINGLARRFSAWQLARGVDLTDAPLCISTKPVPLDDLQSALMVRDAVSALSQKLGKPPVLIIVDTLARNFSGDENSTKDMNLFIRCMDALRVEWQSSILIVHHTGKDTSKGARGSSALKGAIDTEYSVEMDDNRMIKVQCQKMKDGDTPRPMGFKLDSVKLPILDEDLNDVWSCTPTMLDSTYQSPKKGVQGRGKNQTAARQCLVDLYKEHEQRLDYDGRDPDHALVQIEDWRGRCMSGGGMHRQRFNEAMKSLAELGEIELLHPFVKLLV
jgi:hypothetical protein